MEQINFKRMIELADSVFNVKNDPDQIDVDEAVIENLKRIHSATVSEQSNSDGPIAWVLVFPTTLELMNKFIAKEISEKQLLDLTTAGQQYDAIYLCSAMVLEEFRKLGIAKHLSVNAIRDIQQDHDIKALFVWTFSGEGDIASEKIAKSIGLPLYKRD